MKERRFNEVDSLILSKIACVNLADVVPALDQKGGVTVRQACDKYMAVRKKGEDEAGLLNSKQVVPLFKKLASSQRFGDMRLSGYTAETDPDTEKQFSALVVNMGGGTHFITLRGTDDTLVGWKENFNMSNMLEVPSQRSAADYLARAAKKYRGELILGGHSKGGNLAVYAAAVSPAKIQNRITAVYYHDGAGFMQPVLKSDGYGRIAGRVFTFVPEESIVGLLMEHQQDYAVVKSRNHGPSQHDCFGWEIRRDRFVRLGSVCAKSRYLDQKLSAWMNTIAPEKRREFINAMFGILESTGAVTLTDLTVNKLNKAVTAIGTMRHLDGESKIMLRTVLGFLIREMTLRKRFGPKNP
jgi:hypothetical protein